MRRRRLALAKCMRVSLVWRAPRPRAYIICLAFINERVGPLFCRANVCPCAYELLKIRLRRVPRPRNTTKQYIERDIRTCVQTAWATPIGALKARKGGYTLPLMRICCLSVVAYPCVYELLYALHYIYCVGLMCKYVYRCVIVCMNQHEYTPKHHISLWFS